MTEIEINTDELENILKLIDEINEIEKNNPLIGKAPSPYTIERYPEPKKWVVTKIQYELL